MVVTQRVNRVEPLVIAEQEQDVWLSGLAGFSSAACNAASGASRAAVMTKWVNRVTVFIGR